jgi:hypothetical protein
MAVQEHPTADNTFTIPGVGKLYVFASVADGDTFSCPMAHPRAAVFMPSGSSPITTSVEIGALGSSSVTLTFQLGATSAGALLVIGTGI